MATRPETAKKLLLYWMDASMALVFLMYTTWSVLATVQGELPPLRTAFAILLLAGFFALFPLLMRRAFEHRPKPSPLLLVSAACAFGLVPLLPHTGDMTTTWVDVPLLWVTLAALYLRPWPTALLAVTVVLLMSSYVAQSRQAWPGVLAVEVFNCTIMVLGMLVWRWLWWVIRDAHKSREARARLAVAEERLRFARDLHDLLGRSLSVITLKSELAAKLATKDAAEAVDRAAAEMAMVRRLAGRSLFEVQQAVHDYQTLDLEEELASVRTALEAAGASCVIETRLDDLSPDARTLLAWAVREGGTNVLKHSAATRCAIRIDGGVLEMVNDGVGERPATPGNGLRGLSERLVTAGGSFSAEPTRDGEFLLRAAVPA
ncbi:two-component system sensor histidine kinase DesK [Nonomuraea fuscirosea]|uniref:Two-component system sensor histidine kinase DesK n=1 Tax=Nonomuraea fuscirosea TaxID=1291556 RepID=A0A2T0NAT3_9ACTN|nr:histidine kinase [Nonomuraea fuscirosea]PRX70118.1 two-component system sensor histidine kinase DesK [Nonomuraea fuscirosea]